MSGRFTLFADYEQIIERFNADATFDEELYSPNYNVAPSHSLLSVTSQKKKVEFH